jgi:hypothetical protein
VSFNSHSFWTVTGLGIGLSYLGAFFNFLASFSGIGQVLHAYGYICTLCDRGAHVCLRWNQTAHVFERSQLGAHCEALRAAGL